MSSHTFAHEPRIVSRTVRLWSEEGTAASVAGKGDLFQGPKGSCCLTLRNELSEESHVPTKQETLLGRDTWVEKGTQENYSATWLKVSDCMVMGLVSGLSLASLSDSGSFLVVHTLLPQNVFQ